MNHHAFLSGDHLYIFLVGVLVPPPWTGSLRKAEIKVTFKSRIGLEGWQADGPDGISTFLLVSNMLDASRQL